MRAEQGVGAGWCYLYLTLQGRKLIKTPLGRAHATSLSADRLVSLAGGTDDTWADVDDVTEEDCVLRLVRSLWVGVWVGMGAWLVAAMLFWQWVLISGLDKWIGSLPLSSTIYPQNSTVEVHPVALAKHCWIPEQLTARIITHNDLRVLVLQV